jgi:hypothetical protein
VGAMIADLISHGYFLKRSEIMKIKYEMNCGYHLFTKCPNKKNTATKVGSMSCADCEYFVSDDAEKQIVKCNFKKNKK